MNISIIILQGHMFSLSITLIFNSKHIIIPTKIRLFTGVDIFDLKISDERNISSHGTMKMKKFKFIVYPFPNIGCTLFGIKKSFFIHPCEAEKLPYVLWFDDTTEEEKQESGHILLSME